MIGKIGIAPCGHVGEHIIGTFVRCLELGCDGTPPAPRVFARRSNPDTDDAGPCPFCKSANSEPFSIQGFKAHCWDCGGCW